MEELIIGEYSFTRKKIGKGAFSNIYLGKNKYTNKPVAIKEISFEQIDKIKENIKREFTLLKRLKHKNIITLHDVYFDNVGKNIYLVLDYYKRGDLSKFLKQTPLKEKYVKKYMRQITDGLCYLYKNKILHRDLKLQNILVTDSGDIVITDFGFARYFESDIMIQTICGSPMYMAPEMILKKKYNQKSDLWSVGIIMYELITGNVPYKAKNMLELIQHIRKTKITLPINFDVSISSHCKELLFQLLQKNPDNRIEWEDLFTHKWFENDEILENENKLLEMSLQNMNQENLFKYTSIKESFSQSSETNIMCNMNNNMNTNAQEIDNIFNLSLSGEVSNENSNDNLLEDNLIISNDSFRSVESSIEEEGKALGQTIENLLNPHNDSIENVNNNHYDYNGHRTTMPIPIYPNQSTMYIPNEMVNKIPSDPNIYEQHNSLSESIKQYLQQSIHFLKDSYQYIRQNRTI